MLPYDREAMCDKCGWNHCTTEYHEARSVMAGLDAYPCRPVVDWTRNEVITDLFHNGQKAHQLFFPEHMHRTCPNCRYEWAEEPLVPS